MVGTFQPTEGANSSQVCIYCPPGTANPIPGSSSAAVCRSCLPGSFAPVIGMDVCTLCAAGEYQRHSRATACEGCSSGYFCEVGTASPRPYPAGTASNATGLTSIGQCVVTRPGFWASLGSAMPTACGIGTYNPLAGQESSAACRRCTPRPDMPSDHSVPR